jgi:nucleoid-associated protein YgaU
MAKFTTYTTKPGDRWDNIAFAAYGNADLLGEIIRANRFIPISAEIPSGIELNIPVKEQPEADRSLLPPWRR